MFYSYGCHYLTNQNICSCYLKKESCGILTYTRNFLTFWVDLALFYFGFCVNIRISRDRMVLFFFKFQYLKKCTILWIEEQRMVILSGLWIWTLPPLLCTNYHYVPVEIFMCTVHTWTKYDNWNDMFHIVHQLWTLLLYFQSKILLLLMKSSILSDILFVVLIIS